VDVDFLYDDIGNRKQSQEGGDANGTGLQTTTYTANPLNQYTNIVTPGVASVNGLANATNTVTVNGAATVRQGEYWWRETGVANALSPVWAALNEWQHSTKRFDRGTVLSLFEYPHCSAIFGKWLSRDPLAEIGFSNLSAHAGNNPTSIYDYLALCNMGDLLKGIIGDALMERIKEEVCCVCRPKQPHHSDMQYLGGDSKQPLTLLDPERHGAKFGSGGLHGALDAQNPGMARTVGRETSYGRLWSPCNPRRTGALL
jgi:hypothetical protein